MPVCNVNEDRHFRAHADPVIKFSHLQPVPLFGPILFNRGIPASTECRGAVRRSDIAFPTTDFVSLPSAVRLPAPAFPQSAFYLFPKLDWVRVLADGAQGGSMTTGANYGELCCHFIRNGLKLLNWPPLLNSEGEANVDNSTFLAATPGTFVRARTRKVKSEREKALSEP